MSTNERLTPNLYTLSNLLQENKTVIGNNWIKMPIVKAVFNARKISVKKFRDGYGIPNEQPRCKHTGYLTSCNLQV